jgi:hypothetical protein
VKALAVILACLLATLGPHLLAVLVACAAGAAIILLAAVAEKIAATGCGLVPDRRAAW